MALSASCSSSIFRPRCSRGGTLTISFARLTASDYNLVLRGFQNYLERETRVELATSCLEGRRSTAELLPHRFESDHSAWLDFA